MNPERDDEARPARPASGAPIDRARLDRVFGQTIPEVTEDDRRTPGEALDDDFWQQQRPPHHG